MGRQPYIPLYVGDYLKDTRILPLAVRGAWVDLILFMWDAPVRGELIGTIEDFARLMSCERSEAEFALNLLKQKRTADFDLLGDGQIKIVSRKMKRDAEISKIRSEAGKNGVKAKKQTGFAEAKQQAKPQQNTEVDIDNEIVFENKKERDFSKPDIDGDAIVFPHDTEPMRKLWAAWKEVRWSNHQVSYAMHGEQADLKRFNGMTFQQIEATILAAIAGKWKNLYPEKNGNGITKKPGKETSEDLAKAFAERRVRDANGR